MLDRSRRLAATSSRCSAAAASAPALRWAMAPISTPVRCATSPASRTMGCSLSTKRLTADAMSPISSRLSSGTRLVRSPSPAARSFKAAISRRSLLNTRRPNTTATTSSTPRPTSTRPRPMRQRSSAAASRTVCAVLACIAAALPCAFSRRSRRVLPLSAAAPTRLSPTNCSPLAISAAKRWSRALNSWSIPAVETPITTLPISAPLGLIEASTKYTAGSRRAASITLSSARSPCPLSINAWLIGFCRFR
ncbi:hypothetical protein D3C76_871300 [compost metagenome]